MTWISECDSTFFTATQESSIGDDASRFHSHPSGTSGRQSSFIPDCFISQLSSLTSCGETKVWSSNVGASGGMKLRGGGGGLQATGHMDNFSKHASESASACGKSSALRLAAARFACGTALSL